MDTHNRYVAHIDVLGMTTLVKRDPQAAWEALSQLVEARKFAHDLELTFTDTKDVVVAPDLVRAVTFSDTILLFTKSDSATDLRVLIVIVTEMLNKALRSCVPVRADISRGLFFFNNDESMYVGPALIEAYEIGEAAQWIGIAVSKVVYEDTVRIGLSSGDRSVVVPARIPHKDGYVDGYVVDWPAVNPDNIASQSKLTGDAVYQGFDQYFGPFDALPADVRKKYENTAMFINWSLAL